MEFNGKLKGGAGEGAGTFRAGKSAINQEQEQKDKSQGALGGITATGRGPVARKNSYCSLQEAPGPVARKKEHSGKCWDMQPESKKRA